MRRRSPRSSAPEEGVGTQAGRWWKQGDTLGIKPGDGRRMFDHAAPELKVNSHESAVSISWLWQACLVVSLLRRRAAPGVTAVRELNIMSTENTYMPLPPSGSGVGVCMVGRWVYAGDSTA